MERPNCTTTEKATHPLRMTSLWESSAISSFFLPTLWRSGIQVLQEFLGR